MSQSPEEQEELENQFVALGDVIGAVRALHDVRHRAGVSRKRAYWGTLYLNLRLEFQRDERE